jgi:hydroxymethylpyrimidine/phosphomethylpyrimidine kinase
MGLSKQQPLLLAVAGHDPSYRFEDGRGSGAGVDADREAAGHFGVSCVRVVTAWTEQAAGRVLEVGAVSPGVWLSEAVGYVRELRHELGALKFGLLPGAAAVEAALALVREARRLRPDLPVVLDPVLAASGGEVFLDEAGRRVLLESLLAEGIVLTPNRPEAASLTGLDLDSDPLDLVRALCRHMRTGTPRTEALRGLVLKGGHGGEDPVCDHVVDGAGKLHVHQHPRKVGASLHGSGCRHASAVAAGLALGRSLPDAAAAAGTWLGQLVR